MTQAHQRYSTATKPRISATHERAKGLITMLTTMQCSHDSLTLSGSSLQKALQCLKDTGLLRLLDPKRLLAVSRPLSDLQRVNLVVFGCLLLVEEQAFNGNAQRHFIEAQEKKLKRLAKRLDRNRLQAQDRAFLSQLKKRCGCKNFSAAWSGSGWQASERLLDVNRVSI